MSSVEKLTKEADGATARGWLAAAVSVAAAALWVAIGALWDSHPGLHAQLASAGVVATTGLLVGLAYLMAWELRGHGPAALDERRSTAVPRPSGQPHACGQTIRINRDDYARSVPFLPLTILQYNGRTVLAFACACGEAIERGAVIEFEDGNVMVCHQDCLERL